MKRYRVIIDVKATDRPRGQSNARRFETDLERHEHLVEAPSDGLEERIPVAQKPRPVVTTKDRRSGDASLNRSVENCLMIKSSKAVAPDVELPPDTDGKNDDRAAWAAAALQTFMAATGSDYEDALSDLLADLMHWSDRNRLDWDAELVRARGHYRAEIGDEEFL